MADAIVTTSVQSTDGVARAHRVAPPAGAVLVGVNRARGSRPLEGAVPDVLNLRTALLGAGVRAENVDVLTDAGASRTAVLAAIDRLVSAPQDSRVIFAFAGHARRKGGLVHLVTGDGSTISSAELARSLGRVRASMWVTISTCYAGGFAVPGIVGPGRVATFASAAGDRAMEWQGESYMFRYMVSEALVRRRASVPTVEAAFAYAVGALQRDEPGLVPLMDDRYAGDFTIGHGWPVVAVTAAARPADDAAAPEAALPSPHPRETMAPVPPGDACGKLIRFGDCPPG